MTPRLVAFIAVLTIFGAYGSAGAQSPDPTALHDALHLTPVQEAAWHDYRLAVAPDPAAAARRDAAQSMMATLPTPRRIDLINAEMEADIAVMRRQGEAVKAFYAKLTPVQQHIFDQQTQPRPDQGGGR